MTIINIKKKIDSKATMKGWCYFQTEQVQSGTGVHETESADSNSLFIADVPYLWMPLKGYKGHFVLVYIHNTEFCR